MRKKIYKVGHQATEGWIEVEIDFGFSFKAGDTTFEQEDQIKAMVEYWTDWETRLAEAGNDYTKAFVVQLGTACIEECFNYNHSLGSLIETFSNREGYTSLGGLSGITLLNFGRPTLGDFGHFDIEEK